MQSPREVIVPQPGNLDRPDAVVRLDSPLGGPNLRLTAPGGVVDVALKGAQVLTWQCPALGELLWCSPAARLNDDRPMRGGIPICWPWFGPHPRDPGLPAHGVARTALWTVIETAGEAEHAHAALSFSPLAGHGAGLTARLDIRLAATLRLSLTTRNASAETVLLTAALHTYLAVGDIASVSVDGVGDVPFIDKVAQGARRQESGALAIDREIDRIYSTGGPITVLDRNARRRLSVSSRGSSAATVVWNPWIEKAQRLGDMPPEHYRRMLCVETAHAGEDARILKPGETVCLETEIAGAALV